MNSSAMMTLRRPRLFVVVVVVVFLQLQATTVYGCTDVLVTRGASEDGSPMIAYNSDSGNLMGLLYHYPPTIGKEAEERRVYEWDTGKFLGVIPEVNETYNVVGNINEYGLCIGESTFGGVEVLAHQDGAILDYGSLIYITLSRAKTSREAIKIMVDLMDTYGYASEGESFSISDRISGDVWIMEVISRGSSYNGAKKRGAVWVARRIPDGMVSAHANQARIRTFPRDDPENCLYAEDVVDVAIHYGLYDGNADPLDFSFSDVYAPVSFGTARLSEARVWSAFSQIVGPEFEETYMDYVTGNDLTHRMPLWVKPSKKLSVLDLMNVMNSHYEGTPLDSSHDVGAGLYQTPYRPRPLEWSYDNKHYHNERSIGTQQTGWNFVAQIRMDMPLELSAVTWFAVDDSSTSPRVPVYGSSRKISAAYAGKGSQDGVVEPLLTFDITKAFWVQNMVSNLAYSRWMDMYPLVRSKIDTIHQDFVEQLAQIDQKALEIYNNNSAQESIDFVTDFSVQACDELHQEWFEFYGTLFARFRDFFEIVPNPDQLKGGCDVKEMGMTQATKKRIVDETGSHYQNKDSGDDNKKKQTLGYLRDDHSTQKATATATIVAY